VLRHGGFSELREKSKRGRPRKTRVIGWDLALEKKIFGKKKKKKKSGERKYHLQGTTVKSLGGDWGEVNASKKT